MIVSSFQHLNQTILISLVQVFVLSRKPTHLLNYCRGTLTGQGGYRLDLEIFPFAGVGLQAQIYMRLVSVIIKKGTQFKQE